MKTKYSSLILFILLASTLAAVISTHIYDGRANESNTSYYFAGNMKVFAVPSDHRVNLRGEANRDSNFKTMLSTDPIILNYLFYRLVSEIPSVSAPGSGQTTVYGKVMLYNDYARYSSALYVPGRSVYVGAYDMDSGEPYDKGYIYEDGSGSDTYLGSTRADTSGFFSITFSSDDGWLKGTQDVFLQFYADIAGVCVIVDSSGKIYEYRMRNDYSDTPDNAAVSLYVDGTQRTDKFGNILRMNDVDTVRYYTNSQGTVYYVLAGPTGEILSILLDAAYDFDSIEAEYNIPTATVWYPANTSADYGAVYYFNTTDRKIWAPGFFDVNYTQLLYAYGQFLLWYAYGQSLSFFEPVYNKSIRLDQWSAWVNGWAIFFAEWYIDKNDDNYFYNLQGLERIYDEDGSRDDDNLAWEVAALLWDLYDNVNDDQDGDGYGDEISVSLNQMWYVIKTYRPTNIQEFLDSLISYANLDRSVVWKVAWEHGINIDHEAPTRPSIYSYSPSANVWVNDSNIYISWTAAFDSVSGLDHYVVHAVNAETNEPYRDYIVNKSQTYWSIEDMPSGEWYFSVGAVDVAGNENTSTRIGPIKIDTLPPYPSDYSPDVGIEYYDNVSQDLVLWVRWRDGPSGIDKVYFRYKIGSEWSSWILATYDSSNDYYYVVIDEETWKSAGGDFLYWDSKAVDYAGNVEYLSSYFGTPYIKVFDDDSDVPSVQVLGRDIMDNSTDNYRVEIIAIDPSGIYNITFVIYFGDVANYTYYNNSIVWGADNHFFVDVPWDVWINYVEEPIYIDIYVWDNDNDWSGDHALAYLHVYYGYIYDDDIRPPVILNATFEEVGGSDGIIEADEASNLRIEAYDPSGVNYTVGLDWGTGVRYFDANPIFDNGTYAVLIIENIHLDVGGVNISIVISDLDRDRAHDFASGIDNRFGIEIPKEYVDIDLEDSEINVMYDDYVDIWYSLSRNDGGVVGLNGTNITIVVISEGQVIATYIETYSGSSSVFTFRPQDLNVTNGVLFIKIGVDSQDPYFYSDNATLWVYVWIYSEISMDIANTTPMFGQKILITVNLTKEDGSPLVGEWVKFYLLVGNDSIYIGSNSTDSGGIVRFYWIVSYGEGDYTIIARYDGSEIFYIYESQTQGSISIRKGYGFIEAYDSVLVYTDGGEISGYVNDSYGNPIPNANVSLYINVSGDLIYIDSNLTNSDGIVVFSLNEATEDLLGELGNYTFLLVLSGDDRFYGNEDWASLSYIEDDMGNAEIHAETSYVGWGDILQIMIYATDDEGFPITHGYLNISLVFDNGTLYLEKTLIVEEGIAYYEFNSTPIKPLAKLMVYVVVWSDYYRGIAEVAYRLLVVKEAGYVLLENVSNWTWHVEYNSSSQMEIKLIDDDGEQIYGYGTMIVDIEGYVLYNGTLRSISIEYPLLDLMPGTYYINIKIWSEYYDLPSHIKIALVIDPIQTTVSVLSYPEHVEYGDAIIMYAQVFSEAGNVVSDAVVAVFVESTNFSDYIGSFKANGSGVIVIAFNATYEPGLYTIKVEALASVLYGSSSTNTSIEITKEEVILEVSVSRNPHVGERAFVFVRVVDNDNDTVMGIPIGVYLGDKVLAETMVYGYVNISWIPEESGSKVLRVVILDNEYYQGDSFAKDVKIYGARTGSNSWIAIPIVATIILGGSGVGMFVRKRRLSEGIIEEEVEAGASASEEELSDVVEEFFEEFGEL